MNISLDEKKHLASTWFRGLRDRISKEFEKVEEEYASCHNLKNPGKFRIKPWLREGGAGGGGEINTMYGNVFESVGVNISTVHGKFSPEFAREMKDGGD